jgi:hypothetical protein
MFAKLKSLFTGAGESSAPDHAQLAMPLFSSAEPIAPPAIIEQWALAFPRLPALELASEERGRASIFVIDGCQLVVMHMPMAVPNDEAVHTIRSSWMWHGPDEPVRRHQAHAVIVTQGRPDPIRAACDIARLSHAVLKAGTGVALYWGNGRQIHAPRLVEQFTAQDDMLPVPLWVGVTLSGDAKAGPFSAATHGLEALGHKEFEVLESRASVGHLRTTLLDLALYVLKQGPILLDGQTFGPDANTAWKVRHTRSVLVKGRNVIRLGIP